jgi:hypothetical protein
MRTVIWRRKTWQGFGKVTDDLGQLRTSLEKKVNDDDSPQLIQYLHTRVEKLESVTGLSEDSPINLRVDVLEKSEKSHMCWAVGSEIDEQITLLSSRIDALEAAQSIETKNISFSFTDSK